MMFPFSSLLISGDNDNYESSTSYDNADFDRLLKSHNDSATYITTSVTIRVTPANEFFVSWLILWCGFLVTSIIATFQVYKDRKKIARHHHVINHEGGNHPGSHPHHHRVPSGGVGGGVVGSTSTNTINGASDDHGGTVHVVGGGEAEGISTADITRCMFRRLLLLAMIARLVAMPIQIYADPVWWQFVADTMPEMIFASAWTLLVSFFVQLVGVASGTGTNTSPGIVIQITAYVVYLALLFSYFWKNLLLSVVLLYSLLCCIYAALFGTVVYYCPKLLLLLKPSLVRHSGLAVRLVVCSVICIIVFGTRTVFFARNIIAPPKTVYWWLNYGVLELIPSAIFLVMMHPSNNATTPANRRNSNRNQTANNQNSSNNTTTPPGMPTSYPPNYPHHHHHPAITSGGGGGGMLGGIGSGGSGSALNLGAIPMGSKSTIGTSGGVVGGIRRVGSASSAGGGGMSNANTNTLLSTSVNAIGRRPGEMTSLLLNNKLPSGPGSGGAGGAIPTNVGPGYGSTVGDD